MKIEKLYPEARGATVDAPTVRSVDWLSVQLALARAADLARRGRYDEADALLAEAASGRKPAPEVLDLRARIRAQQGRYLEAEALWVEAARLDPANDRYRAGLRRLARDRTFGWASVGLRAFGVLALVLLLIILAWSFQRGTAEHGRALAAKMDAQASRMDGHAASLSALRAKLEHIDRAEAVVLQKPSQVPASLATTETPPLAQGSDMQPPGLPAGRVETRDRPAGTARPDLAGTARWIARAADRAAAPVRRTATSFALGVERARCALAHAAALARASLAEAAEAGRRFATQWRTGPSDAVTPDTASAAGVASDPGTPLRRPPAVSIGVPGIQVETDGDAVLIRFAEALFAAGVELRPDAEAMLAQVRRQLERHAGDVVADIIVPEAAGHGNDFVPGYEHVLRHARAAAVAGRLFDSAVWPSDAVSLGRPGEMQRPSPDDGAQDCARDEAVVVRLRERAR